MSVQRDPRDSMTSTWRKDRKQWTIFHYLIDWLQLYGSNMDQDVPVFKKTDKMAWIPHIEQHKWIVLHALWPFAVQQAYISLYGKNWSPVFSFIFYNVAFTLNAVHQLHMMRGLGHIHGFLDGDVHGRDEIPDHSVGSVVRSLISTATFRPMMSVFLAYRTSQGPLTMSLWTPVEIGLYGIILDFWFYWYHRCMHHFDGLWKFHRRHHLTKHPNPLLTLYADTEQEIFDIAIIPLMTYLTLRFMGFPMGFYDWWLCHQYIVFTELWGHSGIRVYATPANPLALFLRFFDAELAIEDHDLHHRKGWKKSMNYGKQTLLWDRAFKTAGDRIETKPELVDYNSPITLNVFG
ncbi:hypothetical protein EJ05DRAFT_388565 [Pseudovirgaria hyperparasitica]|uniref:Fatty acid hydroxylase domain-containing protein n=1 Tax=Pseudovirgaria hyperparasitica TaxID=470096 RepID=A0A6A6W751_9PEZI|nr:uncharacterized protein EJ05DRAFT_388565 [Pseudovirgaria hyperparasitica]KAF2757397.1 hypothetical protein EJ05DRAFT_388565 [Pseudovirgaria hyperparasitica]